MENENPVIMLYGCKKFKDAFMEAKKWLTLECDIYNNGISFRGQSGTSCYVPRKRTWGFQKK